MQPGGLPRASIRAAGLAVAGEKPPGASTQPGTRVLSLPAPCGHGSNAIPGLQERIPTVGVAWEQGSAGDALARVHASPARVASCPAQLHSPSTLGAFCAPATAPARPPPPPGVSSSPVSSLNQGSLKMKESTRAECKWASLTACSQKIILGMATRL